ncbi:uncharacterized protein LOC144338893 [Macaca mulatta]
MHRPPAPAALPSPASFPLPSYPVPRWVESKSDCEGAERRLGGLTSISGDPERRSGVPTSALGARVQPWGSRTPPGGLYVCSGAWSAAVGVPDAAQESPRLPWGHESSPGGPGRHPGSPMSALGARVQPWGSRTPPGGPHVCLRDWRSPVGVPDTAQNVQAAAEAPVQGGGRAREPRVTAWTFPERRGPRNGRGRRVSVWAPVPVPSGPRVSPGRGHQAPRARGRSGREPMAGIHSTCLCE